MKPQKSAIVFVLTLTGLFVFANSFGQRINTIAGTGVGGYNGDGIQATAAELNNPDGMSLDNSGNIYISEPTNSRIRKITPTGIISTIAGNGTAGYSGDGLQATATEINNPTDVVVDSHGNVFIADEHNHRIRMVNTSGVISTVAGNGTAGYSGDGFQATAAELDYPAGVYVDAAGNMFIADYMNSVIRKVNTSGVISTIAGNGGIGYTSDGVAATSSELNYPIGVTTDPAGNVIIADNSNNRIRLVNTSGIISTIGGNGVIGFNGDGGAATSAELNWPTRVSVDAAGNILIADWGNGAVRQINTSGTIHTLAGTGTQGYSGDGGLATAAELSHPCGAVVDGSGNIFIDDEQNHRVRKINTTEGVNEVLNNSIIKIYPNPSTQFLNITFSEKEGNLTIKVMDIAGKEVLSTPSNGLQSVVSLNVSNLASGLYFLNVKGVNTNLTEKFIKE